MPGEVLNNIIDFFGRREGGESEFMEDSERKIEEFFSMIYFLKSNQKVTNKIELKYGETSLAMR